MKVFKQFPWKETLLVFNLALVAFLFAMLEQRVEPPVEIHTETVVEKTVLREPFNIFSEEGKKIIREYCKEFTYREDIPLDRDTQEYIYYLANAYSIDPNLVTAVIEQESSYNSEVVSTSNDYGLMQVNGANEEWLSEELGITDLLEPHDNIYAGVYILSMLFEKYEDVDLVLMAYNMGEAGAKRLWGEGIYESAYSKKVMEIYRRLRE